VSPGHDDSGHHAALRVGRGAEESLVLGRHELADPENQMTGLADHFN